MDESHEGTNQVNSGLRIRGRVERISQVAHTRQPRSSAVITEPASPADGFADAGNRTGEEPEPPAAPKRRGRPKKSALGTVAVGGETREKADSALSEDGREVRGRAADPAAVNRARNLFREIGARFNENRRKSKATAYERYQHDLMENMDTLVLGGVIELKEITATITNLEQYMRDNTGDQGKSQAQLLAEWLRVPVADIASPAPQSE